MKHIEKGGHKLPPFNFWAGFWNGMDSFMALFSGPPKFIAPVPYGRRYGTASDWNAVGTDFQIAAEKMRHENRVVNA